MSSITWIGVAAFGLFGLLPLALAFFIDKWYYRLPYIRSLESRKSAWDSENAYLPASAMPIGEYRLQKDMGAKITVAHHLADTASDIRHKLVCSHYRTLAITVIGVFFIGIAEIAKVPTLIQSVRQRDQLESSESLNRESPHQPLDSIPTSSPSLVDVGVFFALSLLATYTVPIGAVWWLTECFVLTLSLIDQSRKFERLLEPNLAVQRAKNAPT